VEEDESTCEEEIDDEWKKNLRTKIDLDDMSNENASDIMDDANAIPPPKILFSTENPDENRIDAASYE